MSYAETYRAGYDTATRKRKAKRVAQPVGRLRRLDEAHKRRKRNTKRQAEVCSGGNVTDAILKTVFKPRLQEYGFMQQQGSAVVEKDFYASHGDLSERLNIDCSNPNPDFPYPYNIAKSLSELQHQLRSTGDGWRNVRLVEHDGRLFFANQEFYGTGSTLLYIPVIPLYRLSRMQGRKKVAELLLSVFAYLYQSAGIPYYRDQSTYLYWQYESAEEAIFNEGEQVEQVFLDELEASRVIGDIMKRKITNAENLTRFGERLERFEGRDYFERICFDIAKEIYGLSEQSPGLQFNRRTAINRYWDDEESGIMMNQYVSFVPTLDGDLADYVFDGINYDLQEYSAVEEPVRYIPFDNREIAGNDFAFEMVLLLQTNKLIELLVTIKNLES
ncbi:MAG: hypothetical protein KF704_02230 [Crocinitomicaceae bacterium]|nr:hypothetical protein [Crocinitomicaceae bacterium]